MIARARLAISRTVILLPGSGRPLELAKVDCVKPSSRARLVIISAKLRSLPAIPSARIMQESLPLWMIAPCRRSSTAILLWMAANMVEPPAGAPPLRQAVSLTRYSSVRLTSPCLMAWKTTSAVISFIMLEGARNSSAFFSNRTLPLEDSLRIGDGDPRRIAVEAALLLLGALHTVVGGIHRAGAADRDHDGGSDQAAPRAPCRGFGLA